MRANRIKQLWAAGQPVLNGWLSLACPFSAEVMAAQGYDSLTIDMQHGMVDFMTSLGMMQAMAASGVVPMARVAWLDPVEIMRILDAGAYGIICPMIESREDAERLVSYVRYPPTGVRSFGPSRAVFSAGADYGERADEEVLCFAMIETRKGFDNLEAIAATPGLDGIYIGPADLALALTGRAYRTGFDRTEPELIDAIKHIREVAHAAGIRAALHCGSASYAAEATKWKFDLLTVSNDVRLLAAAARDSVEEFRRLAKP